MFEQVKKVLVDAIHVDEDLVTLEANLKDDLNIDSLAAVELALELESEFKTEFTIDEVTETKNVSDIKKNLKML